MSDQQQNDDQKFWQTIDTFINLANEQEASNQGAPQLIGASMLFAAARYNTFLVARANTDLDTFKGRKADAIAYFTDQFAKMLEDNWSDYETNFDQYRG